MTTRTETLAVADESDGYPRADGERHHGLTVWELGEDGDSFMIEGHDLRRAMAAFSRFYQHRTGPGELNTGDVKPTRSYVKIVDQCGCTTADHAQHLADAERNPYGLDCDCDHRGLPPCRAGEEFSWYAEATTADAPGALAVTWVKF